MIQIMHVIVALQPEHTRPVLLCLQLSASLAFVVLYVWSTYSAPTRGSLRHAFDLALSAAFAADYALRMRVRMESSACKSGTVHSL